jgi:hypothetical protein
MYNYSSLFGSIRIVCLSLSLSLSLSLALVIPNGHASQDVSALNEPTSPSGENVSNGNNLCTFSKLKSWLGLGSE